MTPWVRKHPWVALSTVVVLLPWYLLIGILLGLIQGPCTTLVEWWEDLTNCWRVRRR